MKHCLRLAFTGCIALALFTGCDSAPSDSRGAVEEFAENVKAKLTKRDVIQEAMREQKERDRKEWTSGNISKHPDLYLEHCRKTLESFSEQYKSAILEVRIAINECEYEIKAIKEKCAALEGFFPLAHEALTSKDTVYPKKIGVFLYDTADEVRNAVVKTDAKLKEYETRILDKARQKDALSISLQSLEDGYKRIQSELDDMNRKQAVVKAEMLSRWAQELCERMNAVLGGANTVVETFTDKQIGRVQPESPKPDLDEIFARRINREPQSTTLNNKD